jgi:hypothetical protein
MLYKFRSLGGPDDYCRAKQIIETGKFWHAKFWDMNDPMEGVFQVPAKKPDVIRNIFNGKAQRVLCSFSGKAGFENPILWGYYANGFRGCAIEVEVDKSDVKKSVVRKSVVRKMQYKTRIRDLTPHLGNGNVSHQVEQVLTRKLTQWKHEDEYRSIKTAHEACPHKVGKIHAVYFGMPYQHTINRDQVTGQSESLQEYFKLSDRLAKFARQEGIECRKVCVEDGKVVSVEW